MRQKVQFESIEHAKKTTSAPNPMEIDPFPGNSHTCGKYGHSSVQGGAEKFQCAQCGKIMDSVGHEATHHPTKIHRKQGGKVIEKEMTKEHRRVANPKEEWVEPKGKAEVKQRKERLNEVTEPPEKWTCGSWEQWSN